TRLIFVNLKDSTGALTRVDLTALPNFSNLFTAVNPKDRWYPLESFDNVEMPIADSSFEETASGRKFFIKSGKRSFNGDMYLQSPEALNIINSFTCSQVGVYAVDANNNLIGIKDGSYLYPISINNKSLDAKIVFASDANVQKMNLTFDFLTSVEESKMWLIPYSDTNFDFNLVSGIKDVVIANSETFFVDNGFFFQIDYLILDIVYKNAESDIPISGLNPSFFKLYIFQFYEDFNGNPIYVPPFEATNGVDINWVITDLGNGKYKLDISPVGQWSSINNLYGLKYFSGGFEMSSTFFNPYQKVIF
ncbi:hypothetical protein, partial [Flavobacterium sp.]|uniref:hypothetical protein n=1 Tax=Flavobacterium sp. TaxID=239 RepID=UPI003342B375